MRPFDQLVDRGKKGLDLPLACEAARKPTFCEAQAVHASARPHNKQTCPKVKSETPWASARERMRPFLSLYRLGSGFMYVTPSNVNRWLGRCEGECRDSDFILTPRRACSAFIHLSLLYSTCESFRYSCQSHGAGGWNRL